MSRPSFLLGLLEAVARLSYKFPTSTNSLNLFDPLEVELFARATTPILSQQAWSLFGSFLDVKRQCGSCIEKRLYDKMTVPEFVTRLLSKRPLAFVGPGDEYLLRDGRSGSGGFETIGTPSEAEPLVLSSLLSYDEMCLSALLGVSGPVHFVNPGPLPASHMDVSSSFSLLFCYGRRGSEERRLAGEAG